MLPTTPAEDAPGQVWRYVYYRVRKQDEATLRAAFARMLALFDRTTSRPPRLEAVPVITLARRLDTSANDAAHDAATWLETHVLRCAASVAGRDDVDPWLESIAAEAGLDAVALDGRRIEWFVPCA